MNEPNARIRRGVSLAFVAFVLLLLEVCSFLALQILKSSGDADFLFYDPPAITSQDYAEYLEIRDARLGWPAPRDLGGRLFDATGARPSPAFPESGDECVSLYGDSFTYSEGIDDADAWGNVLAEMLGCRVSNFGVPAYGTDQAFLRFEHNEMDKAPVTILGYYARDVMRNLSQYLHLVFTDSPKSFKPRFAPGVDGIELVPIPRIEIQDLEQFIDSPGRFLTHETFLPNTRFGPTQVSFPYVLSLSEIALKDRVLNWLLRRPSWIDFLKPGHVSQGFEVTAGIIEKFVELCRRRGKHCVVVLFPTVSSYKHHHRTGETALQNLIDGMNRADIDHFDLTPGLASYLGGRSYCDILTEPEDCLGHHSPEGDRVVAKLVRDHLMQRGLFD